MYERYFLSEVLGDFEMLGPGCEEKCGHQGVYFRADLYFRAGSNATRYYFYDGVGGLHVVDEGGRGGVFYCE